MKVCVAPPPSSEPPEELEPQLQCGDCEFTCPTKIGLSQHRRKAHPEDYHTQRAAEPIKRKAWTDEEICILASDFLDLEASGFKGDMARELVRLGKTTRTYDVVRNIRSKPRFTEALEAEKRSREPPAPTSLLESPSTPSTPTPSASTQARERSPTPPLPSWSLAIRAVFSVALLATVDVEQLVPGAADLNQQQIDDDFIRWLPQIPERERKLRAPRPLPKDKRRRRRVLYARVQQLYRKDRSKCADSILDGTWEQEGSNLPLETQDPYWRNLFETASLPDKRLPDHVREVQWALLAPISEPEVVSCLNSMDVKTSPGLDQFTLKKIRQLPPTQLVDRLNLWLYCSTVPSSLNEGYTSLIPKVSAPTQPALHRPITVSSILSRLYNKLLSRRFEKLCPAGLRQKAFKEGDGLAENTEILKHVIKTAKQQKRSIYIAWLDVRKAFDSVSHESLLHAASRAGCPPPLLEYIKTIYANGRTRLKVGGKLSDPIRVTQGVKQGDPLSGVLFNLVIDWALAALDRNIGFRLGEQLLSHLAFADDVVLISATQAGLQRQIDRFSDHLKKSGLLMNADKCATLSIQAQPAKKSWVCNQTSSLRLEGTLISALKVGETYKYLGLHYSAMGVTPQTESNLKEQLRQLSRAPLKPQQRLWILRIKVLPTLYHQLVLGDPTRGYLKKLDNIVRKSVRTWTRLPTDLPISAFYADPRDGGLGLASLALRVPELKARRLKNLMMSNDPVAQEVCKSQLWRRYFEKWSKPVLFRGQLAATKTMRRQALAYDLHASNDGRGLRHASLVPCAHNWVSEGTSLLQGRKYNACLGVRLGCLPSKLRASRGRPEADSSCDACGPGQTESLAHQLQSCPRTHGARVKRHNRLVNQAERIFRKKLGFKVAVEEHIRTSQGLRKPDLIIYGDDKPTVVLDVAVSSDWFPDGDPNAAHRMKKQKYETPEIKEKVSSLYGGDPVFSSIAVSWRGVFAPASAADLQHLGFTSVDIGLLSAIALEQGARIHRMFYLSTTRTAGWSL